MHDFLHNMKELKSLSKMWEMTKKEVEELILKTVEEDIYIFEEDSGSIIISQEQKGKYSPISAGENPKS